MGRRRRAEGNNNPAGGAGGAGGGENPNNNNNNHPLLDSLLQRLRSMAQQAGFAEDLIEIPNAQLLLEATAGDVPLAASLYWDDVLARTEQQQAQQNLQAQLQQQQQAVANQNNVQQNLQAQLQQQQQQAVANQNNVAVAAAAALAIVAGQQQAHQAQQQAQQQRRSVLERLPANNNNPHQQQQAPENQDGGSDMDEDDADDLDFQPAAAAAAGGVADSDSSDDSDQGGSDNDNDDDSEQEDPPQPRLVVAAGGEEAGVSVSDDDAAAVRRHHRTPRGSTSSKKRSLTEAVAGSSPAALALSSPQVSSQSHRQRLQPVHMDETEGFLSEHDWIWESVLAPKRDKIPPVEPMDFLWGTETSPKSHGENETNEDNDISPSSSPQRKKKKAEDGSPAPPAGPPPDEKQPGEDDSPPLVPVTWMRAGLKPPPLQTNRCGLSCRSPDEEDIGYLLWKQQMPKSANQIKLEPPYHCRSVTLLPAIVTALIQAGVTVVQERRPSPHVTCQTTLTPYYELSPFQQARQHESRLVDALTALLVIAAQASKQRKAKALERIEKEHQEKFMKQEQDDDDADYSTPIKQEKMVKQDQEDIKNMTTADMVMNRVKRGSVKQENDGSDGLAKKKQSKKYTGSKSTLKKNNDVDNNDWNSKWQKLRSKLNLCPTCWWEKESNSNNNNNNANPPQNNGNVLPDPETAFKIPVSYTHICDLRAYVKSNLDAFTSTGGCFLFLQTILQIHGKEAVQRMVQAAREKENAQCKDSGNIIPPLIRCQCQARYQTKQQEHRMKAWPAPKTTKKSNEVKEDAGNDEICNDCASVELVSLLLTGRVYSSWKGWSTSMAPFANLGVGLLTDQPDQVGRGLTRPLKPIWIIKGPSQYSVMWLNERNSAGVLNAPGFVANMSHWSCWYGSAKQYNKTDFRFMAGKEDIHTMHKQLNSTESEEDQKKKAALEIDTESSPSKGNTSDKENSKFSPTLSLLNKRRERQMQADSNLKVTESVHASLIFTKADLDRVRVHPDDGKFYDDYRLWRYDIVEDEETEKLENAREDSKPRGDHWTPFHRLSKVNQSLVETKLGPKLMVVLRTRWPGAKIDRMEPASPLPLV